VSIPSPAPRPTIFRESGLIVLFLLTLIYLGIVVIAPNSPARVPFGLIELLFAPGYALGSILFFRRPLLPPAAEFSVSVGLSVVFNVLVGFLLVLNGPGVTSYWLPVADAIAVTLGLMIKVVLEDDLAVTGMAAAIRRELRLPGIRPSYRPAVYAVLLAMLVAFAGVVFLSVNQPSVAPQSSIALYGSDGTTGTLPTNLTVGEVGLVVVDVANGASNGPITLKLTAVIVNQTSSNLTQLAWTTPLSLAANTTASEPLSVGYGQSTTLDVAFDFTRQGNYALTFSLQEAGGASLQAATLGVVVGT
jgi:uncharacterized membrane protein